MDEHRKFRGLKRIEHGWGLTALSALSHACAGGKIDRRRAGQFIAGNTGMIRGAGQRHRAAFVADKLDWAPFAHSEQIDTYHEFRPVDGRYDYGGRIMTFFRDGDRLLRSWEGKGKYEVFSRTETVLFWKVVDRM